MVVVSERRPLQGVRNIIRFNWHFYVGALGAALVLALAAAWLPAPFATYAAIGLVALLAPVVVSLAVSAYVYDVAGLYKLAWLPAGSVPMAGDKLLTVNAGFDEISPLLARQWPACPLLAVDFYNPARHTEVSIRRARLAYPPTPGTLPASTQALPLPDAAVTYTLAFLAAHEIRDATERAVFFRELRRVTAPTGQIIVVEHLRDVANFLAYTIGFFHFHSRRTWLATFRAAGLGVRQEVHITPFITAFILHRDAASA